MSLREEMWKYEQITGESAEHVPIIKLGAFLDGYEKGIKALEQQPCEDCISREQAIRATYGFERYTGIDEAPYEYTESVLKDLPPVTPQQTEWIPVSEKLPEPDMAVLLYVKYKSSGQRTYQLGMWNASKQAWEDWRTPYQLEEEFEVIAWMELPEKYEEDNHE